jgi:DnaJ-domain-containing protein 1
MQIPDADTCMAILLEILQLHPEGLSEYDLLQHLRGDPRSGFGQARLDDSADLFRTHFLLFHALYRLRDQLRSNRSGDLDIHVMNIRCQPFSRPDSHTLTQPDPLRGYYLDLNNLEGTTRADIDAMLGRFWSRFGRYDRRREALAVLDLPDDADGETILLQYRRLAMQHHPDRGGDPGKLQAIHAAMAILDPRKQPGV